MSERHDDDTQRGPIEGLELLARAVDQVAEDLETGDSVTVDDDPAPSRPQRSYDVTRIGLWAAVIALTVLNIPHWIGLEGWNETPSPVPHLDLSQPLDVQRISPPRSGSRSADASTVELALRSGEHTLLLVEIPFDAAQALESGARYEMRRALPAGTEGDADAAEPVLSGSVDPARWSGFMRDLDALPIMVAVHALRPGPYDLVLWPLDESPGAEPTLEVAVEVRRP